MDNCKNAKFCVPTITIEIRNIETIDKSSNQILCFCLPTIYFAEQKSWKNGKNYQFLGWKNGTILRNIKSINYLGL